MAKAEAAERVRTRVIIRENAAKSAVEEAATGIRAGAEAEGADRDRAEAEVRAWAEAEIR